MDVLISIAVVVLPVCGIVLAARILVQLKKTVSHAQEKQSHLTAFQTALAMLNVHTASTTFKDEIGRLDAYRSRIATGQNGSSPSDAGLAEHRVHPAEAFLNALQRCSEAGLRLPDQVRAWAKELYGVLQKRSLRLPEMFRRNSEDILKAVVQLSDNLIDVKKQNPVLQNALNEMVALAGLKFIAPNEGDRKDERLHKPYQTIHEPGRERGAIASVAIRGLIRQPGTVILKAYVNLFT